MSTTTTLPQWDRLIRYVSAQDHQTYYGEPILEHDKTDIDALVTEKRLRVKRLSGATAMSVTRTDHEDLAEKLLSPLAREEVPIIRCTGLNYLSHIKETKTPIPKNPTLFLKPRTALTSPQTSISIPSLAQPTLDYEGELAVVIGRAAKNIRAEDAQAYILGYTVANDVSCREWQMNGDKSGSQWCFSKSFDDYAPIGPAIVSPRILGGAKRLRLQTWVNGEQRQNATTSDLCFDVAALIAFFSTGQTLEAGSLILTGTPAGVGLGFDPPRYLKDGDEVVVEIEGIGKLRNVMKFE